MSEAALDLDGVHKSYREGRGRLPVLTGVDCRVAPGEMVALVGPSGSGKTTLLQIAGLLDKADAGAVRIDGVDCASLGDAARTRVRRDRLGFVYQFHHLLAEFTAVENVALPRRIAGHGKAQAHEHAAALLDRLGLKDRLRHRPGALSGGERQRVAIARAVANGPAVLLADEPTGNLDHRTADHVFGALVDLVRDGRVASLIATHNTELAARMDRRLSLQDGVLVEE